MLCFVSIYICFFMDNKTVAEINYTRRTETKYKENSRARPNRQTLNTTSITINDPKQPVQKLTLSSLLLPPLLPSPDLGLLAHATFASTPSSSGSSTTTSAANDTTT
jgi:hypothetical protein